MTDLSSSAAMDTLQALSASLGEGGDKEALVGFSSEKPVRWTYEKLARRIEALAGGLSATGIGPRSRVVVIGSNGPPWVVAVLARISHGK